MGDNLVFFFDFLIFFLQKYIWTILEEMDNYMDNIKEKNMKNLCKMLI